MATTEITINDELGTLVPSQPQVGVVEGDEIEFTAASGVPVTLCLSEKTASILLPVPDSLDIELASGSSRSFTFGHAGPGTYCIVLNSPGSPRPAKLDCAQTHDKAVLVITPSQGESYPVGGGDTQS